MKNLNLKLLAIALFGFGLTLGSTAIAGLSECQKACDAEFKRCIAKGTSKPQCLRDFAACKRSCVHPEE